MVLPFVLFMKLSELTNIHICLHPSLQNVFLSCPTDTEYLRWVFPDSMKRTVFRICYNRMGQRISICDYWNGEKKGLASSVI